MSNLLHWLDTWPSLSILVLGDAILDSYIGGHAERLCREAPAPVVTVEQQQDMAGGAANTAANLASLGSRVSLLSAIGTDLAGERLQQTLNQLGVSTSSLICSPNRSTLSKQRILADQQILARLDQGSTTPLLDELEQALIDQLTQQFPLCDSIIISDYSYGIITPRIIQTITELQIRYPRPIIIDSRCLSAYRSVKATAVKPNYDETLQLLNLPRGADRVNQITPYGDQLLAITGAQLVVVTLDSEGAIGFKAQQQPIRAQVAPVPPNQTSGAGDTFVSALTLAITAGAPASEAISLATTATAVAVQQTGSNVRTTVCPIAALHQAISSAPEPPSFARANSAPKPTPSHNKLILSPTDLSKQVQHYRATARRIVFTNGCFDILHPGHVTYLQQAKALGDILIVGVNSDDSVRRLKGETRPVNSLVDRLTVLAALSCIDYLVPFTELNPNNLIRIICPDLFVKGGDYSRADLPEVDLVEELGGEVRILPYIQNRSTTELIEQIRLLQS